MDELGSILREAREVKGLTLPEVQEHIRINAHFLEALENGQYELLPTPVHARGFLRNYARFLDLDPQPLLERYETNEEQRVVAASTAGANSDSPLQPRSDQPFFNPVNVNLDENVRGTESTVRWVIIVALLVTIGLAASRFVPLLLGRGDGRDNLQTVIEGLLEQSAETEATPAAAGEAVPAATAENTILPTERNNPAAIDAEETDAPEPPAQPVLPATMESIHLRLDITERTWIRVTIDGEVVFEDQVTQGEVLEWDAAQEAHLLTGNAAGVFITINDTEIGKLGGRGEVQEQVWTTTASSGN